MSKKIISLVMVLGVMGAFIAGCSKPEEGAATPATGTTAGAAAGGAEETK